MNMVASIYWFNTLYTSHTGFFPPKRSPSLYLLCLWILKPHQKDKKASNINSKAAANSEGSIGLGELGRNGYETGGGIMHSSPLK